MSEVNTNDLNEDVEMVVEDASVITIPIDKDLVQSNAAAEAKAVGDALALKADKSQITAVNVNGQQADNQGTILINGTHIPAQGTGETTVAAALTSLDEKTGSDIAVSGESGAGTIADAVGDINTLLDTFDVDATGFTAGAKVNAYSCKAVTIGQVRFVAVAGLLKDDVTVGTSDVLVTVPEDYRPEDTVSAVMAVISRSTGVLTHRASSFTLNSSGQVKQGITNSWADGNFSALFAMHV